MDAFIVEGDTTSHGGKVISCSPDSKVEGRPIARLGDMVSCPKCGGVYPIVQVMPRGVTAGGRPPAFEGDKTACGATLIASQSVASAQPTSGQGGQASSLVSHQTASDGDGSYRGRFQVLDEATRQPVANHAYTLKTADGRTISGTTDASGYTQWHEAAAPASLQFTSAPTSAPNTGGQA